MKSGNRRLPVSEDKEERRFPIQGFGTVRWEDAEEAYQTYKAVYSGDQSLERLAQRGGFDLTEFCLLYLGISPSDSRIRREHIATAVALTTLCLGNNLRISNAVDERMKKYKTKKR
jgi:hypothetical protein